MYYEESNFETRKTNPDKAYNLLFFLYFNECMYSHKNRFHDL